MKKIIKLIKNNILGFLVGLSLCLNGVVIAENIITANQVTYKDSTVEAELNSLFDAVDINKRLGSTDISKIGNGTISDAINIINTNVESNTSNISKLNTDIGTQNLIALANFTSLTTGANEIPNVDWQNYRWYILEICHYSNVIHTIVVPYEYFKGTTAGSRPILFHEGIELSVYQNGSGNIKLTPNEYTTTLENWNFKMYGMNYRL